MNRKYRICRWATIVYSSARNSNSSTKSFVAIKNKRKKEISSDKWLCCPPLKINSGLMTTSIYYFFLHCSPVCFSVIKIAVQGDRHLRQTVTCFLYAWLVTLIFTTSYRLWQVKSEEKWIATNRRGATSNDRQWRRCEMWLKPSGYGSFVFCFLMFLDLQFKSARNENSYLLFLLWRTDTQQFTDG